MNKPTNIETVIQQLASSVSRFSAKLGLAPVTRDRRHELTTLIKMTQSDIRTAAAAAKAHPDLFGDNVDPKEILADVVFVEAVEALIASMETVLRGISDEVLARKARSAQGAIAIKRILEAATHTSRGADLTSTLGALGKRSKRVRKAAAPAESPPQAAPPAIAPAGVAPTAAPRLVAVS